MTSASTMCSLLMVTRYSVNSSAARPFRRETAATRATSASREFSALQAFASGIVSESLSMLRFSESSSETALDRG